MISHPKSTFSKTIRCECGKSFPFNPKKHQHDRYVSCPFCRMRHTNPEKAWMDWRPSLSWIRRKVEAVQQKREITKFLDRYYPKNLEGLRAFSMSQWQQGKRPKLSSEVVLAKIGKHPSEAEIQSEIEWLEKLGVRVQ